MRRRLPLLLALLLLPAAARAAAPPELQEVMPVVSRIRGLSVALGMFESDARTSLGVSYTYAREWNLVREADWVHAGFSASGNVAFRSRLNPDDFLATRLGVGFRKTLGGGARNPTRSTETFASIRKQAAGLESPEEVDAFLDSSRTVRRYEEELRPALNLGLDVTGGLESDQRFTRKQWVAGAALAAELDLWGPAARANLFDYPFALFRFLAGSGPFRILGSTVPTVAVGLDRVSPRRGGPRETLPGLRGGYYRARSEVGFRTELTRNGSRVVHAAATWRVYQELGADAAVAAAGLDRSSYVVVTLSSSSGVFMRYTDGRLPLDAENDQTYTLGWAFDW